MSSLFFKIKNVAPIGLVFQNGRKWLVFNVFQEFEKVDLL